MVKHMKKLLICILLIIGMMIPVYADDIEFESDYYLLIDPDNQQILMQQGADELIYPASMTKMMTLIIALENVENHEEMLTLDREVFKGLYEANASLAGFSYNEQVSIKDCLYGLFLPSGAEGTRALAIKTAGSEEEFVNLMNQKAKELGMKDTHFVNTTGLHHKDHVTTLNDLLKLMQYCLNNKDFYEIFTTREYIAISGTKHKELKMNSTLFKRLSKEDAQWILGGKTGYTNPAGLCLASMASKDGRNLILITAHAPVSTTPYHLHDAVHAYNHVYEKMHKISLCDLDDEIIEVDVQFTLPETTTLLYPESSPQLTFPNEITQEDLTVEITLNESIVAPLNPNDVLGQMDIYQHGVLLDTVNLITHDTIELSKLSVFLYDAERFIQTYWKAGCIGLFALTGLLVIRKRKSGK